MRILLLADNWLGFQVAKYLKKRNEHIVGVVFHGKEKRRYTKEILQTLGIPKSKIFDGLKLKKNQYLTKIKKVKPDIGILCGWAYLLKKDFLDIFPKGVINLHPGFLPYNRGMNPNVWPFIEGTPAGSTLHYVLPGIDDGPIIARIQVPIEPVDTGGTLYDKTIYALIELFRKNWPSIKSQKIKPIHQNEDEATHHYGKDVDKLDYIDLDKMYSALSLINILRSRTYFDKTFAYFIENGKKIYIGVMLSNKSTFSDSHPRNMDKEYKKFMKMLKY